MMPSDLSCICPSRQVLPSDLSPWQHLVFSEDEKALSRAYDAAKNLPLRDARGSSVLEALAPRFPQLYLKPVPEPSKTNDEDAAACPDGVAVDEAYNAAVRRGTAPDNATTAHFDSSPADELRVVDTPVGPVHVLYLANRCAFEMFLQCVGHKAHAVPIPKTIGATTYRGLNDWERVRAARNAYAKAEGELWFADMAKLAKLDAFKSELIIISEGPYSNISADKTPYAPEQWLEVSREIRLYHECAHVVCSRSMPDDINVLWDEITADAVGLIKATGCYDTHLASIFLGVSAQGYAGGRFEEYLSDEQRGNINEWAIKAYDAIRTLSACWNESDASDPFAFLLEAKRSPCI